MDLAAVWNDTMTLIRSNLIRKVFVFLFTTSGGINKQAL